MFTLALSLSAFVFSFLALCTGLWACVQVLGWKRSTHRIEYRAPQETQVEMDIPPDVAAQMPQRPTPQTLEQYMRELRENPSYLLDSEDND
jgi:hypothetical protein